jgi:competence protein ComEC
MPSVKMRINDLMSAVKAQFPSLQKLPTRFRAYKLGNSGASFSYFDGSTFTLIEARVNETSRPNLAKELKLCKKSRIDTLHITSWDKDHCNHSELLEILETWQPSRIEYPGYEPGTDCGKACKQAIEQYRQAARGRTAVAVTPAYIKALGNASGYGYRDVLLHPKTIVDKSNDNSTVKLFRTGCFNVLS